MPRANNTQGRGWHGDPNGHAKAGRRGGLAPHRTRGLQAADDETRRRVARAGGSKSRRLKV